MKMKVAILILVLFPLIAKAVDPAVTADSSNNWLPALRNGVPPNLPANTTLNGGTIATGANISDAAFGSSWNGVTTIAPSKNAIYDYVHQFDTDDNGKVNVLDLAAGIPKTNSSGVLSLAVAGADYVAPSGILAFAGFSSITGTLPIANIPTGTTSSTVPFGNDSRFTDTRTPTDNTVSTAKLQNDAVTYAKIQNISATSRILGRKTTGAGDTEELTLSDVLDFVSSAAQGDILYRNATGWVRLPAGTNGQFLKTLGTGANPLWATSAGVVDGQQIFDGSHVLAADFGARKFYASDGTTEVFSFSSNGAITFFGLPGLKIEPDSGGYFFGPHIGAMINSSDLQIILDDSRTLNADDGSPVFDFHDPAKLIFSLSGDTYTPTGLADSTTALSVSVGNRQLIANDGSTLALDWSDPSAITFFGGTGQINANGATILLSLRIGDVGGSHFGLSEGSDGNAFATSDNSKVSSNDGINFFDNSGFHGDGSNLIGVVASSLSSGDKTITGNLTVGVPSAKVGGAIFAHYADVSTTSTNGTENDLYSDTLAASTLGANGDSVQEIEHVQFVSSATASRRLKKYFGGTLIFDSGSLTLSLGGDFTLTTTVIRESSSVVRCDVLVASTSASSVPYSTYTRITGLTLSNTQILKTTGIASGTGAASGDILCKMSKTRWEPSP